ncbi:MAG: hypothetical protein ACRCU5_14355 [Rhizobiaceae bacterium]
MRKFIVFIALSLSSTSVSFGQETPACAKTGASSVRINGKPALKLSDVAACPAGSFEIIPNVRIEGEPMVHINTGVAGCSDTKSPNVFVNGKATTTAGDVTCQ